MSYEKQTWVTGDVITAEKLNHLEGGVEASSSDEFIPIFTIKYGTTGTATARCDKTYEEVLAAIIANNCFRGKVIYDGIQGLEEYFYLSSRSSDDNSDDNFAFERFIAGTSNNKVDIIRITRQEIRYHSNGTIEYGYASSKEFE